MSRQFKATTIFYIPDAVRDFPANTVWAIDEHGDWFYYVSFENIPVPLFTGIQNNTASPKLWPKILYRNYWRHAEVKDGVGAPYFDDIRNATRITIR